MPRPTRHALAAMIALAAPALAQDAPPPAAAAATPADARFAALDREMHGLVDQGKLAGVTTLVAQGGRILHRDAYGRQDVSAPASVTPDTIWRIASMTKPITGVAMMILWEQGKWKLDDPVARFIPEFRDLKVRSADGTLARQAHPMTMRELMSHTAGFDVSAGYEKAELSDTDLQGMIDKLARLPLAAQPGSDWRYGPSVNIQGYLVEKLSGERLDRFFQRHIFDPLRMPDTQFFVAPSKVARVARVHRYDAAGKLVPAESINRIATEPPRFLAGSGGLYSTAGDYFRFAQMLLNGGTLDGARVLKPATVELMRKDVLRPGVKVDLYGPDQPGTGFGLDVAVVLDPAAAGTPQGRGSYYWGGAFGTWFWIDPANQLVFVGMIQNLNGSTPGRGTPPVRSISFPLVYDAVKRPR